MAHSAVGLLVFIYMEIYCYYFVREDMCLFVCLFVCGLTYSSVGLSNFCVIDCCLLYIHYWRGSYEKNPTISTRILLNVIVLFLLPKNRKRFARARKLITRECVVRLYDRKRVKFRTQHNIPVKQGSYYFFTFYLKCHIKACTDFELSQCPRGLVCACSETRLTFTGVQ